MVVVFVKWTEGHSKIMITVRSEAGSEVSDVDWLPGAGGVEEDSELVIVCVTKELGRDDLAEPLDDPGVLVGPGI